MLKILWFFVLGTVTCCPSSNNREVSPDQINYRLPENLIPISYKLTLETDLRNFNGSVIIELQILENTDNITLHASAMTVNEFSLYNEVGRKIKSTKTKIDLIREFYIIYLAETLPKGKHFTLHIHNFNGTLGDNNDGFYLAQYTDEDGEVKYLATTQFERLGARRAFPCFDEPALKSTFAVSLIRPESYTSISNEELISTEYIEVGKYNDTYAETVRMSTYALAFVVSQFKNVSKEDQRVFARPNYVKGGLVDYALEIGIKVLSAFGNYLEVGYALAKMDQIGIPDRYFSPGAMENWGLVTYRESYLLYSNETNTASEQESTVSIIAHEFSHQWFGNLVTLKWWKYLWLNEGFASYFQYFGSHLLYPTWGVMDDMLVTAVHVAFVKDSLNTTQPMNYDTNLPIGAPTYISYSKGASVIRMAVHFLTEKVFRRGLNTYLLENEYEAVDSNALFDGWQGVLEDNRSFLPSDETVHSILTPWVSQKGYPVVNVKRDAENGQIILSQERFVSDNSTHEDYIWPIPINLAYPGDNFNQTTPDFWLRTESLVLKDSAATADWLIVNKQQTGYYRVNYDTDAWKRIIYFLTNGNFEEIHLLNRAQIIDDSYKLAKSGRIDYEIPLSLYEYLKKETEYVPLSAFYNNIEALRNILAVTEDYELFQSYVTRSLEATINKLGYVEHPEDEHTVKRNREKVVSWLCSFNSTTCLNTAKTVFRAWKEEKKPIPLNLQAPMFCAVIQSGDSQDFKYLFDYYKLSKDVTLKRRILKALGCSEDRNIIHGYLEHVLYDDSLTSEDKTAILTSVYKAGNSGLQYTLKFIYDNFELLQKRVKLSNILSDIGSSCATRQQILQLEAITMKYRKADEVTQLDLQKTMKELEWSEKYVPVIRKWLVKNVKK